MQIKQIEKPVIRKRTTLGQAFDDMFKKSLPIHSWEQKQREIRKNIKF
jgi:hypothetical protein